MEEHEGRSRSSVYGVSRLLYRIGLLQGIGYKAKKKISLKLGYSHDVEINVPANIEVRLNKDEIIFYSARLVVLEDFVTQRRSEMFDHTTRPARAQISFGVSCLMLESSHLPA